MIRHTVVFRLRHLNGSAEETAFLRAASGLADIPGVERFEALRQVSPKSEFSFALSMEFANQDAYARYDADPRHVRFVSERWDPEVESFMEIDFVPL